MANKYQQTSIDGITTQLVDKHLEILKQAILKYRRNKRFNALYDAVLHTMEDIKK